MNMGDIVTFGKYNWRVLAIEHDKALIMTEDIIEQRPYHNAFGNVTWADSEIRKYLNGPFYETFSNKERARMVPVLNENKGNPWYGSDGGEDTLDTIFLLSIEDVACTYFGDSSTLLYNPGKNQKYWFQRKDINNAKREAYLGNHGWWWWLRSPGRANNRAVYIWGDGNIGIQGNGTFHYTSNTIHPISKEHSGGIRPALWLTI